MESKKIIPIHGDISPISIFQDTEVIENNRQAEEIQSNEEDLSLEDELLAQKLDDEKELPPVQVAWSLNINNEEFVCGTKGDFSVLIGKAKSKKTALLSMIANKWVKDNPTKKMLYFDTEQGERDALKIFKRIVQGAPNKKNILSYHLRNKNPLERLKLIDFAINNTSDVELVIIDGIRDLVTSINDEDQAMMITSKLLKWTGEKKFHLITIIHQNKGDNNARGHIGAELINKAQLVLSVTKDSNDDSKSIVKKEYDRDAPLLPDFIIKFNEEGNVVVDGITSTKKKTENGKFRINDISNTTWTTEILPGVFDLNSKLKYSELALQIKVYIETKFEVNVGTTKSRELATHVSNKRFVTKIGKDGSRDAHYILAGL